MPSHTKQRMQHKIGLEPVDDGHHHVVFDLSKNQCCHLPSKRQLKRQLKQKYYEDESLSLPTTTTTTTTEVCCPKKSILKNKLNQNWQEEWKNICTCKTLHQRLSAKDRADSPPNSPSAEDMTLPGLEKEEGSDLELQTILSPIPESDETGFENGKEKVKVKGGLAMSNEVELPAKKKRNKKKKKHHLVTVQTVV